MSTLPTVCFLTGTLNAFAGAERMTAVIANALAERGYRVFVLSLWDRLSVFPLNACVEHHALFDVRPSFKREYFSTVFGIRRFVKAHEIDVLIEVDTMLTLLTLPATLGMNVRRIAWEHCHFDEDLGRRARRVARWLAAKFDDAVVVLTERDRQQWKRALRPRSQIAPIGNPLAFPFPTEPAPRTSKTVLAVGRLVHAKGFDILLQAWATVVQAHPDWRLAIVGEGEERPALETQIRTLGIAGSVDLPGARANIEDDYRGAAIFCLSSRYEGFGLVLLEAMAYGLPVLSTDCEAGPKEIIRHEENGLLVTAGSSTSLAAGIQRLIENAALRSALGETARVEVRTRDATSICAHWQQLVNSTD